MIKDSTTKRHDNPIHHRILALICAVAIAMLQCAVLVSVDWDEVYAADEISVTATLKSGKSHTEKYNWDDFEKKTDQTLEDGSTADLVTFEKIAKKTGLNKTDKIKELAGISEDFSDYAIDKDLNVYTKDGSIWKKGTSISGAVPITMEDDYSPISDINITPPISVSKKGDTQDLNCELQGDSFFSKNNFEDVRGTITWTSSDSSIIKVTPKSDDTKAGIEVLKEGKFSLTVKESNSGKEGTTSGEVEPTTEKPTQKPTQKPTSKPTAKPTTKPTKSTTKKPTTKSTTEKKPSKKDLDSDKTRVIKKEIAYYNNGKEVKPKFVVKYGDKTLKEGKDYTIEYSNNKNVGNDARVTIKGKGDYTGEITRTFSITKKYTYNNNGGNGGGGHYPTRSSTVPPVTTGSTVPTETYAPDRSITVREVHLGQAIEPTQESQQNDSTLDDVLPDDQDNGRENPIEIEDPTVDFGPAASSAAVAVAACGLGAVGRIRKYRSDMGPVNEQIARALGFGGDGSAGSGDGNAAKSDAGKGKEGKKLFGRSAEKAAKDGAKAAGAAAAGTQAKKRKLPIPRRKDH